METPYTGRATINNVYNGAEIIVPAKKNWFIIIFLSLWLCGWAAAEFLVPMNLFSANDDGPGFEILWIGSWTVGGFFAIATIWWNIAGKERITVSQGVLTVGKRGSLAKTKSYDLTEAKNFRADEEYVEDFGFGGRRQGMMAPWNPATAGTIKFDYGMATIKFGDRLSQAEGEYILQRLRDKKLIN